MIFKLSYFFSRINFARIFILSSLLFIFINLYSGCSTIEPVVSDICSVTDEICFYANSICDLYSQDSTRFKNSEIIFSKLTYSLDRLHQLYYYLKKNDNKKVSLSDTDLLIELHLIRDDLKDLLPE